MKRFITIEKEGIREFTRVILDTETGVQYLFSATGYAGGLTVLVDRDGKPLLDKRFSGTPKDGAEYPDDRYN